MRKLSTLYFLVGALLIIGSFALVASSLFKEKDEITEYSNKLALCSKFARDYLANIRKFENIGKEDLDPGGKWEMAIWVETDVYNLCMSDLNEESLGRFQSWVVKKYQK